MRMLVSTTGSRPDDFCFVPEDELVYEPIIVCCNSETCGCNRSMSGTKNFTGTTTVKVAEVDLSEDDLRRIAGEVAEGSGWPGEAVLFSLWGARKAAEQHPLGSVLRPRYNFADGTGWEYEPDTKKEDDDDKTS